MSLLPTELFQWGPCAFTVSEGGFLYTKERGYTREFEYHPRPPFGKSAGYLRYNGWLGSPYLKGEKKSHDRTLYRENLERLSASSDVLTKGLRDTGERNKQAAEVYRALRVARLAMGNVTSYVRRLWRRIPSLVFRFPVRMSELASEMSGDSRTYGITGVWNPKDHFLWKIFAPRNRRMGLQGGHLKRSLPAPITLNKGKVLEDFARRVTEPANHLGGEQFRKWISEWVSFYRPAIIPDHFDLEVTHSACLETRRGEGGRGGTASLVQTIISVGARPGPYSSWLDFMKKGMAEKRMYSFSLGHNYDQDYLKTVQLITGCLNLLSPFIEHRKVCDVLTCQERGMHPRVCPIVILEKGNKSRIPTMTSAPEVILASVFRSAIQHWMVNDPRIGTTLRGQFPPLPHSEDSDWVWRSQDLTTATDDHDFFSTPYLYRELEKYIQVPKWWGPVIDMITGPHELITSHDTLRIRSYFEKDPLRNDWDILRYPKGRITRRCQFMGTPTSWPLLPLVTLYSYESTYKGPLVTIRRKVAPLGNKKPGMPNKIVPRSWYDATSGTVLTETLSRKLPITWRSIDTTGDDCIAHMSRDHSDRHTQALESIGGRVSKTKDFVDSRYSIYTEVYLRDGVPIGVVPFGPSLDIHGVRQSNYMNVGTSISEICRKHGAGQRVQKKLAFHSTFYPLVKALWKLGAPVGYPPQMGGLSFPGLREIPSRFSGGMVRRAAHWTREQARRAMGETPWSRELLRPSYRPSTGVDTTGGAGIGSEREFAGVAQNKAYQAEGNPELDPNQPPWFFLRGGGTLEQWKAKVERQKKLYIPPSAHTLLSGKQLGDIASRAERWSKVDYDADLPPRNLPFQFYMDFLIRHASKEAAKLEPTWTLVRSKATSFFEVPWDSISALAGPRMTLGPYGPSAPRVLLRRREHHSEPLALGDAAPLQVFGDHH